MTEELSNSFRELDGCFLHFVDASDTFHWNSSDVIIPWDWSLKIPVALGGSIISYSFFTVHGDIGFGVVFKLPDGSDEEVVLESNRVPSDVEAITGSFKVPREGVVYFKWDNSFSWLTSKLLSYSIELHQPSLAVADNTRAMKARNMLHANTEDIRRSELRLAKANDRMNIVTHDLVELNDKIRQLQLEVSFKTSILKNITDEVSEINCQLTTNLQKKIGLCIRCLERPLLARTLSYLTMNETASVCKYWRVVVTASKLLLRPST